METKSPMEEQFVYLARSLEKANGLRINGRISIAQEAKLAVTINLLHEMTKWEEMPKRLLDCLYDLATGTPSTVKMKILNESDPDRWEKIIELHTVPRVGDFVQRDLSPFDKSTNLLEVTDVVHYIDKESQTVAEITVKGKEAGPPINKT